MLEPHEYLLWSGRPDADVLLTTVDALLIPVGVYLVALGTLFTVLGAQSPHAGPGWWFASGLILVGLFHIFGRLYFKRRRKLKTAYAITNRRVIVLYGERAVTEYPLPGGSRVTRISRNGRHMSITFGNEAPKSWFGFNNRVYPNTGMDFFDFGHRFPVAFYDVADVEALKAALARVSESAPPAAKS